MISEKSYLSIVWAECIATFDDKIIKVGERYRLGIRYSPLLRKEAYYILDKKDCFGIPIYVEKESGYFKEELRSISFIKS